MSGTNTSLAQKPGANIDQIAREVHDQVEQFALDAHDKVEQFARESRAQVEEMLRQLDVGKAEKNYAEVAFKEAFGEASRTVTTEARGALQVVSIQEQEKQVIKTLKGDSQKAVLEVLDHQKERAIKLLTFVNEVAPLTEKGGCFSAEQAAKDFSTVDPERLAKLVAEANQIVGQLPADAQKWILTLPRATRNQLLRQMVNDNKTDMMERIRYGLLRDPPVTWPDPSDEKGCLQLLQFVARDRRDDVRQTVDRKLQSGMAALCGRIDQARKLLSRMREEAAKSDKSARERVGAISDNIETFLKMMYTEAAADYGLSDYSLLAVGSLARGEVFPYSDLDYSLVAIEAAESTILDIENYLNWQLALLGEDKLDRIGAAPPGELAEQHVRTVKDVLLDGRVIASVGEKGSKAAEEYFEAIRGLLQDVPMRQAAMVQTLASEKERYSPTGQYLAGKKKDVKKGLLRLPTFTVRNLIVFHGLLSAPKDITGRCEALRNAGHVGDKFVQEVLQVVDFATQLRLKLHSHYKKEDETFYLPGDAPTGPHLAPVPYILEPNEIAKFNEALAINQDIYDRVSTMTKSYYCVAEDLLKGATVNVIKDDKTLRKSEVSGMVDLPGKTAILEEVLDTDGTVIARAFQVDGVTYLVTATTGELRATRGTTRLVRETNVNPFLN
jgi:hypothetical protein